MPQLPRLHDRPSCRAVGRLARLTLPLTLLLAGQACAQGDAADRAGASGDTAVATDAIAHSPWAPMGRYEVGARIRYRAAGNLWYDGVIKQVGPDASMPEITKPQYLVDGQGWYDHQFVAGSEREPYWTEFFLGDWEVSVPVAMNTKVIDGDLYRVVSGGMPLPPLRVHPDGRYQWRVTDGDGTERVIEGRWVPREDAPGIVLQQADQGADWSLYNVTDQSARETFGRAQIYLSAECCSALTAQRIPTRPAGTLSPGDRVFQRRANGSFRLGTVKSVDGDRVELEFQYLGAEWVPREDLRAVEFP
jgi:hypothetical protein